MRHISIFAHVRAAWVHRVVVSSDGEHFRNSSQVYPPEANFNRLIIRGMHLTFLIKYQNNKLDLK
jgi:hypothetical protein